MGEYMNYVFIFLILSGLFLNESLLASEAITDQQRVTFFDEVVQKANCDISRQQKINFIKSNEKCLVLDADTAVVPKKIIVKLSCRPEEVQFSILKLAKEYCQTLNPSDSVDNPSKKGASTAPNRSASVAASSDTSAALSRRPVNRPTGANTPSSQQRRVIYTDVPAPKQVAAGATSSDSSKATTPVAKNSSSPVATAAPVAGSSSTSRAVIGGCGTQEQCEAVMAEAAKPKFGWQSPRPFMNAPINKMDFMTSEDGHQYELPTGACGPSNQGELVAIDYGSETVVAACMGAPGTRAEDIMAKIKSADVSKLPKVVAVKKELYSWQCLTKPDELANDQIRICNGAPGPCEKLKLGHVFSGGPGCGSSKCVRFDGGGLATDKPKPKVKGPCDE